MENLITVTKTETRYVQPNLINIRISAVGEDKRCAAAVAECKRLEAAVYSLGHKLGISVAYSNMQVTPVVRDGKPSGYRAVKPLFVEVFPPKDLGDFLDGLGEIGVIWYSDTEFIDHDGTVHKELVDQAVKSAVADAKAIAAAAGVKLGGLYGVEYAPSCAPVVLRAARAEAEPQSLQISETVVCSFKIA